MTPFVWLNGAPGVGKSTVARELLPLYPRGLHLELDRIRENMVSGYAPPVGTEWTAETEHQFQLAMRAGAEIGRIYTEAGIVVAMDHCSSLSRVESFWQWLAPQRGLCVVLMASLETNLERNRLRTNKSFDPEVLVPTIEGLHRHYREFLPFEGVVAVETDGLEPMEIARRIKTMVDMRFSP